MVNFCLQDLSNRSGENYKPTGAIWNQLCSFFSLLKNLCCWCFECSQKKKNVDWVIFNGWISVVLKLLTTPNFSVHECLKKKYSKIKAQKFFKPLLVWHPFKTLISKSCEKSMLTPLLNVQTAKMRSDEFKISGVAPKNNEKVLVPRFSSKCARYLKKNQLLIKKNAVVMRS